MKRWVSALVLLVLLAGITAAAVWAAVHTVGETARTINEEKTALVQARLDETLALLTDLSEDDYIRDPAVTFRDKATLLTNKNSKEDLGYMMIRILDSEVNIYREDQDYSNSNLASRDYMQRLYTTGEPQVTDAFLAGADGETVNFTVAVGILENNQVTGALFAAIYGEELDELLKDARAANVLVGSKLQYMGGIDREHFGMAVAQVLELEQRTSRPVENILLDFQERKSGAFWGMGNGGVQCFTYAPLAHCDWVVLTEVPVLPLTCSVLVAYGVGVLVLLVAAVVVLRPKKSAQEES